MDDTNSKRLRHTASASYVAEPMSSESDFQRTISSLWFRLVSLAVVALVFSLTLALAQGKAQGWTYFLTVPEVAFEVVVRLIAAALAGVFLGTACTAIFAPVLWHFKSSRQRLVDWVTKFFVVLVVFLVSRYALQALIKWSYAWHSHREIYDKALLAGYYLAFALALCTPRGRREVTTSLDCFLGEKVTRRTAIATVVGTAALVATEFALAKLTSVDKTVLPPQRHKNNILLITFDALGAEDMSLYGYRLPTTPNIDAFARKATVFTQYFSSSTFTTPGVATMLTGIYPSESKVYHFPGRVRAADAEKSLPHLMRAGGYATCAFFSNPIAYYLAKSLEHEFDVLPEPIFRQGGLQHLWDASRPLHQDSGIGSRFEEYFDLEKVWSFLARMPANLSMRFRAVESFERAQELLAKLPDGFFMWIHVMTPHDPYLPDSVDRGRFLPEAELRTFEEESGIRWFPHYPPDQQNFVDRRRLGYGEFVATADRAFGSFMSDLEESGRLRDTTVILSADHGESFEGGVYQHFSLYLTRPVIHIPLIIRTPGQQGGRTVAFTADQTSLAPTILELAGLPKPNEMRGQSLVAWLNQDSKGEGKGLAFSQYLAKNSVFKPLRRGALGVIDGQYQYVFYLDTHKGELRPLHEAHIWNLDRSAEYPAQAAALRAALHARFPDLVPIPS